MSYIKFENQMCPRRWPSYTKTCSSSVSMRLTLHSGVPISLTVRAQPGTR